MLFLALFLAAVGSVLYSVYGVLKLQGDAQAQAGSVVMGIGGLLYLFGRGFALLPSVGLMVFGVLLVLNVVPLPWATPVREAADDAPGSGGPASAAPALAVPSDGSPVLGGILMAASLPILGFASPMFWANVHLLITGIVRGDGKYAAYPLVVAVQLVIAAVGGGLFYWGFRKSGAARQAFGTRAALTALPILAFCWYGVAIAVVRGRLAMSPPAATAEPAAASAPAPAAPTGAPAPAAPAVPMTTLASPDGSLSLAMPACWKAEARPGRLLYATCGAAALSLTELSVPPDLGRFSALAASSVKQVEAAGSRVETQPEPLLMPGNQPIVGFRFRQPDGTPCGFAAFGIHGRSYTYFWKGLSPDDSAALDRALDAAAAAPR